MPGVDQVLYIWIYLQSKDGSVIVDLMYQLCLFSPVWKQFFLWKMQVVSISVRERCLDMMHSGAPQAVLHGVPKGTDTA